MTNAQALNPRRSTAVARRPRWADLAVAVWGVGALLVLIPLLRSRRRVDRLVANALPLADRRVQRIFTKLCAEAACGDRVELREHPSAVPMACGLFRHVIVLPRAATQWSDDRIEHVLLHELAHVVRRDALAQTAASLAVALYWFHPLVWIAARELRREREQACDDAVLAAGGSPTAYATDLLDLTTTLSPLRAVSLAALTFARSSHMHERIHAVLETGRCRTAVSPRKTVATWSAVIVAVALIIGLTLHPRVAALAASRPAASFSPKHTVVPSRKQTRIPEDGGVPILPPGQVALSNSAVTAAGRRAKTSLPPTQSAITAGNFAGVTRGSPVASRARDGRPILVRIRYASVGEPAGCHDPDGQGDGGWSHDYPMSVQGLMTGYAKVTKMPVDSVTALMVTDPAFMQYPIAMVTEPGCWNPTMAEVSALRKYLASGGMLLLDDLTFGDGTPEHLELSIARTEKWLKRVLPNADIAPVPASDPIFSSLFEVNSRALPSFGMGNSNSAQLYGIYQDNDSTKPLQMVAVYRGILGHHWRWSNGRDLAADTSAGGIAYRMGINIIAYGLSR